MKKKLYTYELWYAGTYEIADRFQAESDKEAKQIVQDFLKEYDGVKPNELELHKIIIVQ